MSSKTITNALKEPALKSLQQSRKHNKVKYNYEESNEAYKLNVTHLQKIRKFLGNNGKIANPLQNMADIPGLFPVRDAPSELPPFGFQKKKETELSFSTNDAFNKILKQREVGVDFRTLAEAG